MRLIVINVICIFILCISVYLHFINYKEHFGILLSLAAPCNAWNIPHRTGYDIGVPNSGGTLTTSSCSTGYSGTPSNFSYTCNKWGDGKWYQTPNTDNLSGCTLIQKCASDPPTSNGYSTSNSQQPVWSQSGWVDGTTASYKCAAGYNGDPNLTITCSNSSWVPSQELSGCSSNIGCSTPPPQYEGYNIINSWMLADPHTFYDYNYQTQFPSCAIGYTGGGPNGNFYNVCSNNIWITGPTPTSVISGCTTLEELALNNQAIIKAANALNDPAAAASDAAASAKAAASAAILEAKEAAISRISLSTLNYCTSNPATGCIIKTTAIFLFNNIELSTILYQFPLESRIGLGVYQFDQITGYTVMPNTVLILYGNDDYSGSETRIVGPVERLPLQTPFKSLYVTSETSNNICSISDLRNQLPSVDDAEFSYTYSNIQINPLNSDGTNVFIIGSNCDVTFSSHNNGLGNQMKYNNQYSQWGGCQVTSTENCNSINAQSVTIKLQQQPQIIFVLYGIVQPFKYFTSSLSADALQNDVAKLIASIPPAWQINSYEIKSLLSDTINT